MQLFRTREEQIEMRGVMKAVTGVNSALFVLFLLCALVAGSSAVKDKLALFALITGGTSILAGTALIATAED